MKKKSRRRRKKFLIPIGILAVLLIALTGGYLGISSYFKTHFFLEQRSMELTAAG